MLRQLYSDLVFYFSIKHKNNLIFKILFSFIKLFNSNLNKVNLKKYMTLMDWFLRIDTKLNQSNKSGFYSPANGKIINCGSIRKNLIFYSSNKKINCSINQLLNSNDYSKYIDGEFCNIYLSPLNYHYFISPMEMEVKNIKYISGDIKTVSELKQNKDKSLFIKNERYIVKCKSKNFEFILIPIGAIGVSGIYLKCFKDSINNIVKRTILFKKLKQNFISKKVIDMFGSKVIKIKYNVFEKLGLFLFGSTIIILTQKNTIKFNKQLIGKKVNLGQKLI
ncbi:phosphatidylserine decarboxylase [Candidatus Woesearchaeota archaeon]|nr:phosphatidylserine decarboxylase [Candidatus Woesearchaeota archaeon]